MNTDRELLELAAKAVGAHAVYEFTYLDGEKQSGPCLHGLWNRDRGGYWNPLTDDGDALRLAVKLHLHIHVDNGYGTAVRRPDQIWHACEAHKYGGLEVATRRAIVRAAAEIGKAMP